jgi:hypothetical protein
VNEEKLVIFLDSARTEILREIAEAEGWTIQEVVIRAIDDIIETWRMAQGDL